MPENILEDLSGDEIDALPVPKGKKFEINEKRELEKIEEISDSCSSGPEKTVMKNSWMQGKIEKGTALSQEQNKVEKLDVSETSNAPSAAVPQFTDGK